jgi:hypothetical protein
MYQIVRSTFFLTAQRETKNKEGKVTNEAHPALRVEGSPNPVILPEWFTKTDFYEHAVEKGIILEVRGKPPAPPAEEYKGPSPVSASVTSPGSGLQDEGPKQPGKRVKNGKS